MRSRGGGMQELVRGITGVPVFGKNSGVRPKMASILPKEA